MPDTEVRLRPITAADAPFLCALANDSVLMEALCEGPTSLAVWEAASAAWSADADEAGFLILPPPRHQPAGWIAINGLGSPDRVAWIKMLALHPTAWGSGAPARQALAGHARLCSPETVDRRDQRTGAHLL